MRFAIMLQGDGFMLDVKWFNRDAFMLDVQIMIASNLALLCQQALIVSNSNIHFQFPIVVTH